MVANNPNLPLPPMRRPNEDKINPRHYTDFAITPIDAIEVWGLGFCLGNAIKYIARAGKKENEATVDDLKKALWYLNREIEKQEKANVGK